MTHTGALAKAQTYTSTLSALVPPTKEGQYRVIVRPDIFNEVFEAQFEANNKTTSANAVSVAVPEVHLAVPVDLTLSTGQVRLFRVAVGVGETLRVQLTSSESDAANEVFVRYENVPNSFQFDAVYQNPLQANQTAIVPATSLISPP